MKVYSTFIYLQSPQNSIYSLKPQAKTEIQIAPKKKIHSAVIIVLSCLNHNQILSSNQAGFVQNPGCEKSPFERKQYSSG